MSNTNEVRSLRAIARDIKGHWPNVYFSAAPYLQAMEQMESINEDFGWDPGKEIVLYFLANAQTWKGEHARRVKAELKAMAGIK